MKILRQEIGAVISVRSILQRERGREALSATGETEYVTRARTFVRVALPARGSRGRRRRGDSSARCRRSRNQKVTTRHHPAGNPQTAEYDVAAKAEKAAPALHRTLSTRVPRPSPRLLPGGRVGSQIKGLPERELGRCDAHAEGRQPQFTTDAPTQPPRMGFGCMNYRLLN